MTTINLTFLGTSSAQPSATRNHQCIALRLDGDIWLFDAGEASQHQLQRSQLRMGKIEKVFVTHMHGDHCFGLPPLLCTMTNSNPSASNEAPKPPIEIFGPSTLRRWLRSTLKLTRSTLGRQYTVHELLLPTDPIDSGDPTDPDNPLHHNEILGRNILIDTANNAWSVLTTDKWSVIAAPIVHSIPSLGYVLTEHPIPGKIDIVTIQPLLARNKDALLREQGVKNPMALLRTVQSGKDLHLPDGTVVLAPKPRPGRRIVILGDTSDPSLIAPHARDADLVVHEATNAKTFLDPPELTYEEAERNAISHGHSTPQMAGRWARGVNARRLVLTHFSARYKGDDGGEEGAQGEGPRVMEEIRRLAVETFGEERDGEVFCARDFWSVDVPRT
ncbi:beta-lactamase-like protein [Jimgerdemannia flammicorona]|uniref:Beta-lactamase-like protein n=2 Tax=Jimgerdemannia flammicorona TaxID=994334 RepID=A0A433QJ50_9FUNG|nr:beta-lactamase-like protein [Jimgerdemannia flammicorona]RUS29804.1 beta-lactamase-like protein [Jimgerdemannia flammicorona]